MKSCCMNELMIMSALQDFKRFVLKEHFNFNCLVEKPKEPSNLEKVYILIFAYPSPFSSVR